MSSVNPPLATKHRLPSPDAATRGPKLRAVHPLAPSRTPIMVIDTNVWLDWLLFDDRAAREVFEASAPAGASIACCAQARSELAEVIARPYFGLDSAARQACLARHDKVITQWCELPDVSATRLRCTDRADQKFVELAVCSNASVLLTRDKALLKLAKRALREHALTITTLARWSAAAPIV